MSAVRAAQSQEPFDALISAGTVVDMMTVSLRKADVGFTGCGLAAVLNGEVLATLALFLSALQRLTM